jgi:hypothetical protein
VKGVLTMAKTIDANGTRASLKSRETTLRPPYRIFMAEVCDDANGSFACNVAAPHLETATLLAVPDGRSEHRGRKFLGSSVGQVSPNYPIQA